MKIDGVIFACLLLAVPVAADLEFDFSGRWRREKGGAMFFVELWQDADILRGSYCAVAMGGNRIDCDPQDKAKVNIWGTVLGNTAEVQFFPYYGVGMGDPGSDMGKAKFALKGDQLEWTITEPPSNGHYWCPQKVVLGKDNGE